MSGLIKKMVLVARKPDLSAEAFSKHWRENHGPLVASSPDYGKWRLKYIQNHILKQGPIGASFDLAGIAEFWLPGSSPNEDDFTKTPIYQERIKDDELKFLDMKGTVSFAAAEDILVQGTGKVKLMVLSTKKGGMSEQELKARYKEGSTAALANTAFLRHLRGWTVNYTIEGTFRLAGGFAAETLPVDCVEELWFDSIPDCEQAVSACLKADASWPSLGGAFGSRQSFIAEELVFFDAMTKKAG